MIQCLAGKNLYENRANHCEVCGGGPIHNRLTNSCSCSAIRPAKIKRNVKVATSVKVLLCRNCAIGYDLVTAKYSPLLSKSDNTVAELIVTLVEQGQKAKALVNTANGHRAQQAGSTDA